MRYSLRPRVQNMQPETGNSNVIRAHHIRKCRSVGRVAATCALTVVLTVTGGGIPSGIPGSGIPGRAVTITDVVCSGSGLRVAEADELEELTELVAETQEAYDEALDTQEELAARIDELDGEIAELESALPAQEEASDESLCALYKYSSDTSSVVLLILESDSLTDMLSIVDSYTWIIEHNLSIVAETVRMQTELEDSRVELEEKKAAADDAADDAADALASAQAARQQAQEEAIARQKAEEEAKRKAAEEAAAAAASAEEEAAAEEEATAAEEAASQSSASGVDWSSDKTAFVSKWASRIDSYLAGSATAGLGEAYAEAAWDYGVDPRWAPAISAVESTKGAYCFASHNAWGYGSSGFSSWESGIQTVVAALGSSTYGGYHTRAAAKVYCPDNADEWYERVAAEMAKI